MVPTSERATDESCPHADVVEPFHRMKSDVPGDERRI